MILALILLNVTHWAADYTHLSRPWMLAAKRLGKPILPIAAHAGVHAVFFLAVGLFFATPLVALKVALLQLVSHTLIDIWKGRMNGWFPALQSPANIYHWYIFGFDQLLHQIVIIWSAYLLTL